MANYKYTGCNRFSLNSLYAIYLSAVNITENSVSIIIMLLVVCYNLYIYIITKLAYAI